MVRLKNRYLLVHILYPTAATTTTKDSTAAGSDPIPAIVQFHQPTHSSLTAQLLTRTIRSEISSLYGDYGVGVTSSGLAVKYLSPATSTFILRVARAHYRLAWAALPFITKLPPSGRECVLRVVRVSGTIRKAEEEAIRRARDLALRARAAVGEEGVGLAWLRVQDGEGGGGRGEVDVDSESDEEEEEGDDEIDDGR